WGLGKRSAGVIVVNYRGEPNTMEIIKSHSKITPVMQGGRLKVQIQVWVETNLGELQVEQPITPELLKVLKKRQNEVIRQELTATIMKSQAMKADILDLGGAVHARYPKVWRTLEPKWADYYSQLPVEVLVDSLVSDIGTTNHGHAGR
ncbi:MAG: Ger(x)C family spore germination C-terminal domain-containing protein, partial [Methanomassiliicoccales archaeon]